MCGPTSSWWQVELGERHRDRGPCRAVHPVEDVLRVRSGFRRRAQHQHLPDLSRPSRSTPGAQRVGARFDNCYRAGAQLLGGALFGLPSQELLLRRPPQELSDLPVRRPDLCRGSSRGDCRRANPPVGIERAHMEEDTGKSTHVGDGGRIHGASSTLLDFNRSGVPLVEIVSKPEIHSAGEARAYAQSLRAVVAELGFPMPGWKRDRSASMPTSRSEPGR
jgi:hypothetical protein